MLENMSRKFNTMRIKELKLFIIEFCKASQIDRSFFFNKLTPKGKKAYRLQLLESCIKLMNDVDRDNITNRKIINQIKNKKYW